MFAGLLVVVVLTTIYLTYKGIGDYLPYKNDLDAGPGT